MPARITAGRGIGELLRLVLLAVYWLVSAVACPPAAVGENWPRWRGPGGNAVSQASDLPVEWSAAHNVCWKVGVGGEGCSSPIVWDDRAFLTSAFDDGTRRAVHCLSANTGKLLWKREIEDEWPELTSALTGHAAATPVTDGEHIVAMFGNAGAVCYDFDGKQLWRRRLGEFESELGLASSPILFGRSVILLCDHDGDRFKTFDSFLIALNIETGETLWKTDRRGLFRSWSTPILVPAGNSSQELVINAQDELRGYEPESGELIWQVRGMTGWVAPSPVFGHRLIFAASGKDGPTMAVRPGGRGDVTERNVVWLTKKGSPYVCSPLVYGDDLYVYNEQGVLTCYRAATGEIQYRQRLRGKFMASPVAGDGKVYITNEAGMTYVLQAGAAFRLLNTNSLDEECLASPAVSESRLLIRTRRHLYCIGRVQ